MLQIGAVQDSPQGSNADVLFERASRMAATEGLAAARECLEAAALAGHPVAARAALSLSIQATAAADGQPPALLAQLLASEPSRHGALLLAAEWDRFHGPSSATGSTPWHEALAECYASGDPQAGEWVALEAAWLGADRPPPPASASTARIASFLAQAQAAWEVPGGETLADVQGVCVTLVRAFAPPAALARPRHMLASRLAPSLVVDPRSGQRVAHPVRDAAQAQWLPEMLGWHGKLLEQRLAAAGAYARECGEVTNLLRYGVGQHYRPHLDCLPSETVRSAVGRQQGGQRVLTQLLGVQAARAGGQTRFEQLRLEVGLGPGDLLSFRNAQEDGGPLAASRHAGAPVTAGEKWILSKWVRETTTPYGRELAVSF